MTGYANFPTGYSNGGEESFWGAIYDGKTVWLIPYCANMVIGINVATGIMTGYTNWPTGFTKGANAFSGAVYDGTDIWMIPSTANMIIKISGE